MTTFTIRGNDRVVTLPFVVEADSQGGSCIREEEGKIYYVNRLGGQVIEHREITPEEAKKIIKETIELPVEERFPRSTRRAY